MSEGQAGPAVLIAAQSGRALAACARRGGYRPLVADLFGDLDTRELAEASERVAGSLAHGFAPVALLESLDRLAAGRRVIGVVTGSGFEAEPLLLRSIAARHVLLGNTEDAVAAVKDPFRFADVCARADVPHPEIRRDLSDEGTWLRKRAGGSGGGHIVSSERRSGVQDGWNTQTPKLSEYTAPRVGGQGRAKPIHDPDSEGDRVYYQRRVRGEPVSAAFLAAGGAARMLGLSRQWADPAPHRPFRYGGASRPAPVSSVQAAEIGHAVARLVAQTDLRGLNSADFLVRKDGFDVLEINPRPGATVDIFLDPEGTLFRLHIDACQGVLPEVSPLWTGAAAAATVYARTDACLTPDFEWPPWAADRQPSGELVPSGAPLCTVLAEAAEPETAEAMVRDRAAKILARVEGAL